MDIASHGCTVIFLLSKLYFYFQFCVILFFNCFFLVLPIEDLLDQYYDFDQEEEEGRNC